MAYIGRNTDKISNIEILDNITFDGSSSYSITKSSVAFVPNSAQSLLISIDGVVQATNFTVSSSTIDFGVAIPSTSTCDFFLHYGTGLITTPADGTVTTAKIGSGAVTTAKMFSGFANGITEADAWRITTNTVFSGAGASDVTANWERADTDGFDEIGTGLTESSGIFSFPSTGYYYINYFSSMTATSATIYMALQLMTTPNNSTYSTASSNYGNVIASGQTNNSASFILKVTDITNIKFKFQSERAGTYTLLGSTSESRSGFSCIRLGDI
jgi:hypothetical protein